MRDDELAGLAEFLDGGADFLRLGDRKVAAADAQRHALDAPVALGGIEAEHDVHHGHGLVAEREIHIRGVGDAMTQIEREHHVARQAIALEQRDDDHDDRDQDHEDHELRDPVQDSLANRTSPAKKGDHANCPSKSQI